jgi:hypothetical protein
MRRNLLIDEEPRQDPERKERIDEKCSCEPVSVFSYSKVEFYYTFRPTLSPVL